MSPCAVLVSELRGLSVYERTSLVEKAHRVLSIDSNISRAPGSLRIYLTVSADPSKFCTVNATAKNGKISCDCLNGQATGLCEHILAVVTKGELANGFLKWFNSAERKVNLDAVLNHGISARNGAKARRRTEARLYGSKHASPVERIIKNSISSSQQGCVQSGAKIGLPFVSSQLVTTRYTAIVSKFGDLMPLVIFRTAPSPPASLMASDSGLNDNPSNKRFAFVK